VITTAASPRPATVTVAYAFQLALTGLLILLLALSIAEAVHYDGLIDQAAGQAGTLAEEVSDERAANVAGALFAGIPALLLAVWLGLSSIWVRKGSNVARILTLVGLGAPLLLLLVGCGIGGLMGVLAFGMPASEPGTFDDDGGFSHVGADDGSGFYGELYRLDSGPWSVASSAIGVTAVVLLLVLGVATAILLLTGGANRWFRPVRDLPGWPPYGGFPGAVPMPAAAYPPFNGFAPFAAGYPPHAGAPHAGYPPPADPVAAAGYAPRTHYPMYWPAPPAWSSPADQASPWMRPPAAPSTDSVPGPPTGPTGPTSPTGS
jgi:hypothetical protein